MADGGLTVLEGDELRSVDLSLPECDAPITGAYFLDSLYSAASSALYGLTLPENLKQSALNRLHCDAATFRSSELDTDLASSKFKDFITAIADELKDSPIVVAVLNGRVLKLFLEDEDDFAMIAENLFTDLDTEDKGKISKNEIRKGLMLMGVEMGIPCFSDFPLLNDILKKYGAEGEEELGQAQFAELLQPILKDLSVALAEKPVTVIQNIKIVNGSKLQKNLANANYLKEAAEKILEGKKDGQVKREIIREFVMKNWDEIGLPPFNKEDDAVANLYDVAFSGMTTKALEKDELVVVLKDIFEKFAKKLEDNPVYYDCE